MHTLSRNTHHAHGAPKSPNPPPHPSSSPRRRRRRRSSPSIPRPDPPPPASSTAPVCRRRRASTPHMSQSKEVRYTARSITPPADRNGTSKSKSPTPVRRSTSRSPPPKKSDSRSPPPRRRSTSRSPRPRRHGRSRSRSRDDDLRNPGNNLYVTGLSTRVTEEDLEKFFSKEGKVQSCHVVLDPRTKESRGFAFVTMDSVDDARRCIKYLHRTVLEGRLVTVEKAKRTRERTPTPGKYCGRRDTFRSSKFQALKEVPGAHHLTGLAEGSDLAQEIVRGTAHALGIAAGTALARGIAAGTALARGIAAGTARAQGIVAGTVRAQGIVGAALHMTEILTGGVETGPGHRLPTGTTKRTSKFSLRCVLGQTAND
uniref:RRM domain-containing protein n=1 Tax=Oryza nivara TaxID=4536 RepID=A0A0E0IB88_ORYNI